jgi:uncharacterized damage-inducible protein DinB
LLIAESVWMQRFRENLDNTGYNFWPEKTVGFCDELHEDNRRRFAELLDDLTEDGLDRTATYVNSEGRQFTDKLRDILTHVFFHSGHHRGQILSHIRAAGETPPNVDFMGFVRRK